METSYSQRLILTYALCLNEARTDASEPPSTNLEDYDALEAATYLACYITFRAIKDTGRSPADERVENFDMLAVYQAYAMLAYTYLTLPLGEEGIEPDYQAAAVTIARSLFAELENEELAEIIESGNHKYQLIGDAEVEHWMNYRQDIEKVLMAFVIAATDEEAPFDKEELVPMLGALLSMLCEAFASE
ncbi:hypothetical protein SAMN05192560_0562 [Methylobacillus rhizosphaerae]|uniref:Uncharacterized protein n=1 Tax=Methylobacillus rhizosphaerae TaxID=551994 RepID=A0A238YFH0_9PROT|nr:hypothetical protein [Methylobacillus rhizosphaerae]SNR69887.1 hypothetical protein SAMN05192560_0562 [Methylobacillus rhizosphaerae]